MMISIKLKRVGLYFEGVSYHWCWAKESGSPVYCLLFFRERVNCRVAKHKKVSFVRLKTKYVLFDGG
jgi:hypothetical protein